MNKTTKKHGRTKSLVIAVLVFLLSGAEVFPCSRMPRTPEETFDSYVAVFRGVVTSAEAIPLKPGTPEEREVAKTGLMLIKVRWKIEEIFKGKDLEGKSAYTTNYYCGGVPIIVGQPYVFAIGPIEKDKQIFSQKIFGSDLIGYLDDLGTIGVYSFADRHDKYDALIAGFKKLSKRK